MFSWMLGEPPSEDERRHGAWRPEARGRWSRGAEVRRSGSEASSAKVLERSPEFSKADPPGVVVWDESDEVQAAKARGWRPAVEGARPKEERINRTAGAGSEGPAGNVTVKVSELRGGPLAGPDIIHCSDHCCNVTLMPTEYSQIVAIRGHYGDFTLTGSWAAGYKYPCNCPWWDIEYKDLLPVLWFSCHWAKCRSPSRLRPRRTGLLWYLFARKDILHQQWNSTIFFKV